MKIEEYIFSFYIDFYLKLLFPSSDNMNNIA